MEPGQNEHPLTTTQTLAALAVAALFWSLGVALIDPRAGVGVLLCAIGTVATLWLYWRPLRAIPKTKWQSWPWLGAALLLLEIAIPAYLLLEKPIEEDVRASFFIDAAVPKVTVRYEFMNAGKQAALISTLGLFEIVAIQPRQDPRENSSLCDEISPTMLPVIQMAAIIMGKGAQTGSSARRSSIYLPERITIDGQRTDFSSPLPLESGKVRIVSAEFDLISDHWKDFDTLIICPMVGSRNMRGINVVSICKGASFGVALTSSLKLNSTSTNTWQQYRLIPQPTTLPTCRPS